MAARPRFSIDSLLEKKMGKQAQSSSPSLKSPPSQRMPFLPSYAPHPFMWPNVPKWPMNPMYSLFYPSLALSSLHEAAVRNHAAIARVSPVEEKPHDMTISSSTSTTTSPKRPTARTYHRNINTHAIKKYKCDVCLKAFSRSNTLITHKRIHTGEKPFACDHCGRAFRQPGNLTRHRLTHTSQVKPYQCEQCDKSFNRASNLHTHIKTHLDCDTV